MKNQIMDTKRVLPRFELTAFIKSVGKGTGEQTKGAKIEAEDRRVDNRIKDAPEPSGNSDKKEESSGSMWTTPARRPLAEPHILDWEEFERLYMPSDLRYRALVPNDPWKRCSMKDLDSELHVLLEYIGCTKLNYDDPETSNTQKTFYNTLIMDLFLDYDIVDEEYRDLWASTPGLPRFEFMYLDNDGRTTLEHWIDRGANVLMVRAGTCERHMATSSHRTSDRAASPHSSLTGKTTLAEIMGGSESIGRE